MKFPYQMLRDFVDTRLDAVEIGELLTMAGFELEGIEEVEGDAVLDIKVMSNRGDGLSVFGLAREVLAKDGSARATELYQAAVNRFAQADESKSLDIAVAIESSDCTRYACRQFHDVPKGGSPEKIQRRLRQSGMRPISALVDLTNYVMLEVGQPLHAFDLDKLDGGRIVVRKAQSGEKLTTLDGNEHELRPDQLMICDANKPVAAAGIMGGFESEVTGLTHRVLLESAHFENTSVRRTRKQLGLSTEASYRFERSFDPEGAVAALNRFAMLLREIDGGKSLVEGLGDVYPNPLEQRPIELSVKRAELLLGMKISVPESHGYLERLGFGVEGTGEPFTIIPPTWRPDVVREEDLIEELGRVHGYDRIPEALPHGATLQGGVFGFEERVDRLREALVRLGFSQMISHSLGDRHALDEPHVCAIGPRGIASPEHAYLRSSLLSSLAEAARRNGGRDLHLFEIGRVFCKVNDCYRENRRAALLSVGAMYPTSRQGEADVQADFFTMKGVLSSALGLLFDQVKLSPDGFDNRFHPTRQSKLVFGTELVGRFGQIHPDVAEELGMSPGIVMAEFDLEALFESSNEDYNYRAVSRNPAVRRDIAILIDKSTPYERVEQTLHEAVGEVLEKLWLFDVYAGKGIPDGKHSLAIALQLRKLGENFTDEEANQLLERAVSALAQIGATRR